MGKRVLIPLPDRDFDPTETAVPWRLLSHGGCEVVFATEHGGAPPACDPRGLQGVLFGQLRAAREPRALYRELEQAPSFRAPLSWRALDVASFDGLLLPGGHAPGMRQYLGSAELHEQVAAFWRLGRPVGAICHGVLVLARARDGGGRSVIARSRTTCLPKYMERTAYLATFWKLGRYYRTYDDYVEDEVRAALDDPARQFERGPRVLDPRRVVAAHEGSAFVVEDGRYVSARWPGDAYRFARALLSKIAGPAEAGNPASALAAGRGEYRDKLPGG
jgi:putative intracellular protease/amidase